MSNKKSDEFDLLSLRYNFLECGGSLEEFERFSVGEIIDFIHTYINMKNKQTKEIKRQNNPNRSETTQRSETFSFGRVDDEGNPVNWQDVE